MNNKKKIVVLGMSGGVDSSVSAYILQSQGYKVIGVFMRNWDAIANNDIKGNNQHDEDICAQEKDWRDAQNVANKLGIPIYYENFVAEYWDFVFTDLIREYKKGHTPNPDILCNKYIKFDLFLKLAKNKYKADFIATGHYARIDNNYLKKGIDNNKDQTYFLAQVKKENFDNVLFPIGELEKKEVRKIANKLNLSIANKKDSVGICFIGERKFQAFLENYIPVSPGNIIDITTRKIIGKHRGIMYYTIGQRKGINLSGMKEPYYVVGNNLKEKELYVAPQSMPEYLVSTMCEIKKVNILSPDLIKSKSLTAKFRYRQNPIPVKLEICDKKYFVKYEQGECAITIGQQCVIYKNDICVLGGTIKKIFKDVKWK